MEGDSFAFTIPVTGIVNRIGAIKGIPEGQRTRRLYLMPASGNSKTIYVGPNRTTGFPLASGAPWIAMDNVDPALVSFEGTANDVLYVMWGGDE